MKKLALFLLITAFSTCLSGCDEPVGTELSAGEIGLLISSLENPFFESMEDAALKEADHLKLTVTVASSDNNLQREKEQMETLIAGGIKVIIMNPVDSEQSAGAADLAKEAGIHLITIDRNVASEAVDTYIASDNHAGGVLAGMHMSDLLAGQGNLMILEGIMGTSANTNRVEGFEEALEGSEIDVVRRASADFERGKATELVRQALVDHPDLNGILACNDEMALGALEAVLEADASVLIMGFDGTDEAVQAVLDGYLAGTVEQQPDKMAEQALRTAEQLLRDQETPEEILVELKLVAIGNRQ